MDLYTKGYKWALDALTDGMPIDEVEARAELNMPHEEHMGAMRALSDYVRVKTEEVYDDPV